MPRDTGVIDIGEVGRRTGLSASALRYYERQGLIRAAGRRGGRRVYDPGILRRLAVIGIAKEAGFTLAEIVTLLGSRPGGGRRAQLEVKLAELDEHIAYAERARAVLTHALACPSPSLERCEQFQAMVTERVEQIQATAP